MDDTMWAIQMADQDRSPDDFIDALKDAREMGQDDYAQEVIATATAELLKGSDIDPLMNALHVASQAFDGKVGVMMVNGPMRITIEVRDAPTS